MLCPGRPGRGCHEAGPKWQSRRRGANAACRDAALPRMVRRHGGCRRPDDLAVPGRPAPAPAAARHRLRAVRLCRDAPDRPRDRQYLTARDGGGAAGPEMDLAGRGRHRAALHGPAGPCRARGLVALCKALSRLDPAGVGAARPRPLHPGATGQPPRGDAGREGDFRPRPDLCDRAAHDVAGAADPGRDPGRGADRRLDPCLLRDALRPRPAALVSACAVLAAAWCRAPAGARPARLRGGRSHRRPEPGRSGVARRPSHAGAGRHGGRYRVPVSHS